MVHNDRPDRLYEIVCTANFKTRFRPFQLIEGYNPQNIDLDYGIDPYWDTYLYDQQTVQFKCEDPPTDDEDEPEILNNRLSQALVEIWQPNPQIDIKEEINEVPSKNETKATPGLLDGTTFAHVLVTKEGEPAYIPLATILGL